MSYVLSRRIRHQTRHNFIYLTMAGVTVELLLIFGVHSFVS